MNNCKDCDKELTGKFCQNCGFPKETKRINRQYIVDEISSVLNFDKGVFYTIKELFIRPGNTVRNYINGDRKRIVKPIIFLIICSITYTIAQQYLSFEASFFTFDITAVEDSSNIPISVKIFEWFSNNYGYANILIVIFIAIWVKILFRNHNFNYYEIYILLCYIMGNSILIYTLLGIIDSILDYQILQVGIIISLIYTTWAIAQFFDRKNKLNYLKGFLSYVLGITSCVAICVTIGNVIGKMLQ